MKLRDTAEIETPASSATSLAVTLRSETGVLLLDLVEVTMAGIIVTDAAQQVASACTSRNVVL